MIHANAHTVCPELPCVECAYVACYKRFTKSLLMICVVIKGVTLFLCLLHPDHTLPLLPVLGEAWAMFNHAPRPRGPDARGECSAVMISWCICGYQCSWHRWS